MELHRRDVDGDANMVGPVDSLATGVAHRPCADRDDQPGVLGDRNEIERARPVRGSGGSSGSALRASRPGSLQVEQGLEVKFELAALDRQAQVGFDLPPFLRPGIQAFLEEAVAAAAFGLRSVKSEVGIAQQGRRVAPVERGDRDADTGRRVTSWPSMSIGMAMASTRAWARLSIDCRPLVSGCTTTNSSPPSRATKQSSAVLRSLLPARPAAVAGAVAHRVVDRLEMIEVEAEQSVLFVGAGLAEQEGRRVDGTSPDWQGRSGHR